MKYYPRCDCGVGVAYVHTHDCQLQGRQAIPSPIYQDEADRLLIQFEKDDPAPAGFVIWPPGSKAPAKKPAKPRRPPKWPDYRFVLSFFFTRPIDIALWKKIKAPPGWRKNPTSRTKQLMYNGVRFQCDDFKYTLTPEQVQELRATLLMILEV